MCYNNGCVDDPQRIYCYSKVRDAQKDQEGSHRVEPQTPILRIFCAHASQDRAYFEQLENALAVPIRQQRITVWHHGEIIPGAEFDLEIEKQFYQADIILLLISPAFMASDYCATREMQWALRRQKTGEAVIIPLIVKPTPDWEATFLGSLQVLPTGKKPITLWKRQDQAFADVVNGLLNVIREMQQEERLPVTKYRISKHRWIAGIAGMGITMQDLKNVWLKEAQCIDTYQDSRPGPKLMYEKWLLSKETQNCGIDLSYTQQHSLEAISITSQQLMYIDHLLQILPLSYDQCRWTLLHDMDTDTVVQKINEHTGKVPSSYTNITLGYFGTEDLDISYTLSHPDGRGMCVALKAGQTREICLQASYQRPFRLELGEAAFYHAHQMFSPQKIMSMLTGKIPPRHIWQLIDEAWTS